MRDGWVGNEVLQNALQRADPQGGVVLEAVRTVNEDVRATRDEWNNSTGVGFRRLRDGGLKLSGTSNTVAEGATTQANEIVTDLAIDDSFFAMRIIWADLVGVNDRELDSLTIRVNPSAGGGAVEVTEWRAQLYRLSGTTITGVVLQPISAMVSVPHGGGASQQDVTFDFLSEERASPVRVGPDPVDRLGNVQAPRTYIFVWAIKGDGEAAGNVAWMGDSAENSRSTISYSSKPVNLLRLGTGPVAETGSAYVENDGDGVAGGLPWFELNDVSFSAATRQMLVSNGDGLDLGASPTEDVEVVVGTQIPAGTSVTVELAVPGSGSWVEVADGDIIGRDNTPDGGNDLSGLSVRQDYDAQVTLTPPSGSYTTPVIRRLGIRERESTMLHELATLRNVRQAVDPVDLHAEIGSAEIEIVKDGVTDYRDFFSEYFSENHIGEVEFRAWVGSRDIPRRYWLHLDDFLVDDTASRSASGKVQVLNPLVLLKGILPDPTSSPREPLEYSNQTISAVRSDILSNQLAIANRRIGAGPIDVQIDSDADGTEDTDALVTKRLEEADGKPELDALAFLAGGAEISSQGRIKAIQLHNPVDEDDAPHPVDVIPLEEGAVGELSPGYSERVDEFFVSWGWDETANEGRGKYVGDERAFHSPGITKLGPQALRGGSVPRLQDQTARWIPQSGTDGSGDPYSGLARKVSTRQVQTLGVGMITVPVQSTIARPHLELGDVVAVETDRFVGKDPNTDRGVRGQGWLVGPVVAIDDPLGRSLTIWVRSYADIVASSENIQRQSYVTPRVYSVTPSFSESGVLSASIVARVPDSGSVKIAASDTAYPTEATVDAETAQALDAEGSVLVGSLGTFQAGETAYISVKAYENADGTGAESFEVFQVQVSRLPYVEPEITGDLEETETAGTGTFVARDEALRVQAVEFQTKVGAGPWGGSWLSSWDNSTGTAGTDKNLERVESVTKDEKHVTGIKARMTYLDADGVSREKFAVLAVDPERVAKIEDATVSFDSSGNVDVQVEGDGDCANIYVTVGDGSAPADPTAGVNDGSLAGSSGLIQTSVSVTDGAVAIVKVVGENSEGSLGSVRTYRSTRGDPRPTGAVAIDIADTGAASAVAVGDSKVQSWKVAAAIGSAPSDATVRAATAIDQQSITQGDVGTLVTATPGQTVYLGAFAYDQTGGAGRESARLDDTETFGVTSDGIEDNAVITAKINDAAVEWAKIGDDAVRENNIIARGVAARHLFVGSFDNLVRNPGFEQGSLEEWSVAESGGGTWARNASVPRSGAGCLSFDPTGQTSDARFQNSEDSPGANKDGFAVSEGDQIYVSGWGRKTGAGLANRIQVSVLFRDEGGSALGGFTSSALTPTTSYQEMSLSATAPAGSAQAIFEAKVLNDGNSENVFFDDFYARRMVEGSIVVDGTITADHLDVNTLEVVAADMGTLTAGEISVGSMTLSADNETLTFGAASAPLTGTGIFLGLDGADYEFRVGDPSGEFIHWDGATLTVSGRHRILHKSFPLDDHTGTTVETTIETYTLPAGTMGAGGSVRITAFGSTDAPASTMRVSLRFGGNDVAELVVATGEGGIWRIDGWVNNDGTENSQVMNSVGWWDGGAQTEANRNTTWAIDTSTDTAIEVVANLGDSADHIFLDGLIVELIESVP